MSAVPTATRIQTDQFQAEVIDGGLPVIVDFWAPWCGPCRAIAPIMDELAGRHVGKVRVVKVNVDEEPAIAEAFEVRGIPTVVAMRGREVLEVQVGFRGAAALRELADKLAALGPAGPPAANDVEREGVAR